MSYLCDLYKIDKVCIYFDKISCQTSSPSLVEAKDRCLRNLNVEYTSQCGKDTDLYVNDNSFKGERVRLPSRHSTTHWLNVLEASDHEQFAPTAESLIELLRNPDSPILRDVVIDFDDEPIMVGGRP